jgi:hypothetical protein
MKKKQDGKKIPNNGMQPTPSTPVFQMTLVGYPRLRLRVTLVDNIAWAG